MSAMESLLVEYPTAPWDWNAVSSNASVSFKFILEHPDLPWVPRYVSRNKSITESDVKSNLAFPWDYEILCENPNISFAFMNEFIIKPEVVKRINWQLISANPSVTMTDVKNYKTYAWDHQYLSANPNVTSNFILNEGSGIDWFRPFISSNSGITSKDIFKSTLKTLFDWDYKNLSSNQNLPIVYVNDNLDKEWNYHEISCNASLVDIEQYHQIAWDHHGLSLNQNITTSYIKAHPNIDWHLPSLLANSSLRFDSFDFEWILNNWKDSNRSIQTYLCSNATITSNWIKKNKSSVDWKRLSANQLQ